MWRYYEIVRGKTHLFNVERCEKCGNEVVSPNGVAGVKSDVPKYKRLGMIERPMPLNEIWCLDDGSYGCRDCQA